MYMSAMARERIGASEIGEIISLAVKYGAMSFGAGEPSEDMFPKDEMSEAFTRVLGENGDIWGYHHDEFGLMTLREWITERMKRDGMAPDWVRPENVIITNGGGEAMNLVAEALIDPGSVVLVESPTYTESLLTFRKQGAVCVPVPSDDDGLIPEELERLAASRKARFLYTIPNFQNPSGRTTPETRRIEILEILRSRGIALVEDDPYHYLSYDGEPPAGYLRLAGDDKRVIHCNSFSKTIAPGLRCGWAVIPPALTEAISCLRICAGLGRPLLIQRGIMNYLDGMDFPKRISALRDEYRKRRGAMLEAAARYLAPLGVKTNRPGGGFFIWAEAMPGINTREFARFAIREEHIAIIPGTAFYPEGEKDGFRSFRLSYSKVPADSIDEGMRRLARAFNAYV